LILEGTPNVKLKTKDFCSEYFQFCLDFIPIREFIFLTCRPRSYMEYNFRLQTFRKSPSLRYRPKSLLGWWPLVPLQTGWN